jgi:hypothetical protein
MNSHQMNFSVYLRGEVDNAQRVFEQARDRVLALTGGPEIEVGPGLMAAIEILSETTRLYISALRRLAHYSANQGQSSTTGPIARYA